MELWEELLGVLFPASCIGCERTGAGVCVRCTPPLANVQEHLNGIGVIALGPYSGMLRKAILALKDGRRDVAASLGALLAERIVIEGSLVPVPTTRRRRAARGFDQAVMLAHAYAHANGNAVVHALRSANDRAQHGRTRRDRLALGDRFYVLDPALVRGVPVVLVDDVVTTGATLAAAAACVRAAGARVTGAIAVARTLNDP